MKILSIILFALLAVSIAFNKITIEASAYQKELSDKVEQMLIDSLSKCNGIIKRENNFYQNLGK